MTTAASAGSSGAPHSTTSTVPVLITGAGPTGLFEAYLLTKLGISVRIIDRAMAPSPLSKANGIQVRSLEVFQMAGIIDPFLAQGLSFTDFRFYVGTKRVADMRYLGGRSVSHYPSGVILEQNTTCAILIEALDKMGVRVDRGWELTDTKVVEEGGRTFVEAVLRKVLPSENFTVDEKKLIGEVEALTAPVDTGYETQVVRSEYLVAADGARSAVRHKLNIDFPGRTRSHKTLMWDGLLDCDLDLSRITIMHGGNKKSVVACELPNGTWRLGIDDVDLEPGEDISKTLQDLTPAKFEKLCNECIAPAKLKLKETKWLTIFKINERRADHFVHKNRIFLAGDAAHIQSPSGGQGMNTGLHDAHNLAWKLALVLNKAAPEALLATYHEREEMADRAIALTSSMLDMERDMGFTGMLKKRMFYALSPVIVPLMEYFEAEVDANMVDVHYKENALNKAHPTQTIPAAQFRVGVRAQDAALRPLRADTDRKHNSASTRLHELTVGIARFHIVVFASDMLSPRTGTPSATAIQGVSTTTAKELERNIEDFLSIWRTKWSYASNIRDGHKDKDLFKVHVITGPVALSNSSSSVKALADKKTGDGRIYVDDTKALHRRYGFASKRGAGGIVVIRPDSHVGYRVNGAGGQAWKDVQDYFNSILTK
ncbi:hypothetical protein BGZ98_008459 [Dissophora globulifera]|nr:hypothetical protein BGZ98_008459 [Dissophora globulifera]